MKSQLSLGKHHNHHYLCLEHNSTPRNQSHHELPLLGVSWENEQDKAAQGYIYWQIKFKGGNQKYQNQLCLKLVNNNICSFWLTEN